MFPYLYPSLCVIVFALSLGTFSALAPSEQEKVATVSSHLRNTLNDEFAKLSTEEGMARGSLEPTLLYEGSTSTILSVTKPQLERVTDMVTLRGLAVTHKGRYFEFTYASQLSCPRSLMEELKAHACWHPKSRYFSLSQTLSTEAAKSWYFQSDEFEQSRYKAMFNEEPPARRTPA